jgi:hypothetical protein
LAGAAFVYLDGEILDTVYEYKYEGENKWDEYSDKITMDMMN